MARTLRAQGKRAVILSGGELTVTMRGKGKGGPNQEYALALVAALAGMAGVAAVAGDTTAQMAVVGTPPTRPAPLSMATAPQRPRPLASILPLPRQ